MEMIIALIGLIIGSLITWWAAKHYYEKASTDLAQEANELKRLNTLMLRSLEAAGMAEFSRDKEGNIKGMVINLSGNVQSGPATIGGGFTEVTKGNK